MKKLNLKLLFLFMSIISIVACKAQQILPLNTFMENIPQGAFVKDTNNELSPYVGVYKANYQSNEITLFITKEENKLEKVTGKTYFMDALIIKYIVKNLSGQVLQDTQNNVTSINTIHSIGTRPNQGTIIFYYEGTNCGVGWGKIILKKLNSTQISWEYRPNDMALTEENCLGNPDVTVFLPVTKDLIFTKE